MTGTGILCFNFSLNPFKFSVEREADTKVTRLVTVYEPWIPIQFMTSNWSYFEFSHHILQQYLLCLNIFFIWFQILEMSVFFCCFQTLLFSKINFT